MINNRHCLCVTWGSFTTLTLLLTGVVFACYSALEAAIIVVFYFGLVFIPVGLIFHAFSVCSLPGGDGTSRHQR